MTRDEHLQWSKRRALEYLPTDCFGAYCSMLSDTGKHDELASHSGRMLMTMLYAGGGLRNPQELKHFIEGFN